ncbi:Copper-transporting ATPase RAN1 [Sesamum angolense]|uniref:P-type Cu(+) transporter n=1 Tax=Sesamum angolense TaxID=2727404 RepID=A0AAE1WU82_9LAMI|nr:Copper-transporting ATPase RAN1 [Sesamum angolense]
MALSMRALQLTAPAGKGSADSSEEERSPNHEHNSGNLRRIQVGVTGMTCAACSNSVESALRALNGVVKASVALLQNKADVTFDPTLVKDEDIRNAIEDIGFEAELLSEPSTFHSKPRTLIGQFTIGGMTCAACVNSVEGILRKLPGVGKAVVALATSLGEVEYDPSVISKDDYNAIEDAGFEASFVQRCQIFDPEFLSSRALVDEIESSSYGKLKLLVKNPYTRMASKDLEESSNMFRLFAASLFSVALKNGSTNMDVLVVLGTSASYFYSVSALLYGAITGFWSPTYFEASAMLITFVLLGKYLESLAKGKTSDAIKKLVELAPATAILLIKDNGGKVVGEREIDALLIQPGDILKVLPGTKVPTDGLVVWGSSYVNESMVTGESSPVLKEVNSSVVGGTINLHGSLHIKANKVGSNTVLSQIISLVETAQMSKAPIQKFADFVASIFVPAVVTVGLLTLMGWYLAGILGGYPEEWLPENGNYFVFSLMFAISVVVVACPCALGLATPTAVMVGANNGVLIKGGDALEKAQKVKYVIFDKTGTLTQGKATVTTAKVFSGMERGEFLTLVASAEASSEHPLAKEYARHFHYFDDPSTTKDAHMNGQESKSFGWLLDVSDFSALPGQGVQCFIDGKKILVSITPVLGSLSRQVENFVVQLEESAKTGILVSYDNDLIGVLGVSDPLKREAGVVIEGLIKMGVNPVMVTGDNWRTPKAVAKEVGITDVRAEVMPAGKADVIRSFQKDGSVVAMVGDGINDSPALAAADVGMAIGREQTIEAADYVLMRSNLEDVITAIDLSRKTFSRIRWNYVFASAYNIVSIPVAAGVLFPQLKVKLPPWVAGACMAMSSVTVVCSSLLLRRYRKPRLTTLLEITVDRS